MKTKQNPEDFTISEGGPLYVALQKILHLNSTKKLVVFGLCITWVPLIIISAFEGTLLSGAQMPFAYDVAMQARVLIAFPMLIIIRSTIDNKVMDVLKYMGFELFDAGERQLMITTAFRRAKQLSSSALTEIIMVLIVVAATLSMVKSGVYSGLQTGTTSWMATVKDNSQHLSMAGYWSVFVTIPIVQFFILRWYWRYIVWVLLLFRFSKANIILLPTHADKAGGLGIIMIAQRSFCLLFAAIGVILSGQFIATLIYHPDAFNTIRSETIAFIVICIIFLLSPLTFFSSKLFKIKNEGLLRLGNLSADLSRKFEREWVNNLPVEKILEQQEVDPSLIYDYTGMYISLQELRVVPVTVRDIIGMGVVLFIPFIPIIFIHFSIAELLQKIAGMMM
jgi:hypothetical protein